MDTAAATDTLEKWLRPGKEWFAAQGWQPFDFQLACWRAYLNQESGLLNAPTGSGKTYALWMPCLLDYMRQHPEQWATRTPKGLKVLWITPLRALATDIGKAMERVCHDLQVPWSVGVRTGDTTTTQKKKMDQKPPQCLITTPESLHIMLSRKKTRALFEGLEAVIIDEWHELLGSKRGVQIELALSRLRSLRPALRIWGISATIGNLEQAGQVLLGPARAQQGKMIRANTGKQIDITTILPEEVENFPWAGHMGLKLWDQLAPIVQESTTTLLFTNTRAQTEIWYHHILSKSPELAGAIAMHHGSLANDVRQWVEQALHAGTLKLVVCTSSLDLGVDFRPVETVIQVGGPKGVARFMQRAGRSGHQPGARSRIYFVPTNSLEIIEGAALQKAIASKRFEAREPLEKAVDVLIQYLVTLAVGDGFTGTEVYKEVKDTYCFAGLSQEEWQWVLQFITTGGNSLDAYEEFNRVEHADDFYYVESRRVAMRHRLGIGTIVSDPMLKVRFQHGGNLGSVEESFISKLKQGDTFWFAGRNLEFLRVKEMTVWVRKAGGKKGIIPRWMGGRLPLSTEMAALIRDRLKEATQNRFEGPEMQKVAPLLRLQHTWSAVPLPDQLLIESVETREGHHLFVYPFQGRFVHEVLSSLMAYRIGRIKPLTFSIAMNDYGFELLADQEIPVEEALESDLFSMDNLLEDISQSINDTEMAKRRFRDIATISGLVFQGYPGKPATYKHLQASSQLLYDVFTEYDPDNLLLKQSMYEVLTLQLDQSRLVKGLEAINQQQISLVRPPRVTPFAFPIMVDRLRARLTSESLEDRVQRMQRQLESYAANGV